MKIETIPITQAKALARPSRITPAEQQALEDMLRDIIKDEGKRITFDQGEKYASMKTRIETVAAGIGIPVTVKSAKDGCVVWLLEGEAEQKAWMERMTKPATPPERKVEVHEEPRRHVRT